MAAAGRRVLRVSLEAAQGYGASEKAIRVSHVLHSLLHARQRLSKAVGELNNVRSCVAEHFPFSPFVVSPARLREIELGALYPAYVVPYRYRPRIILTTTTSGQQTGYHHIFGDNQKYFRTKGKNRWLFQRSARAFQGCWLDVGWCAIVLIIVVIDECTVRYTCGHDMTQVEPSEVPVSDKALVNSL